MNDYDNAPQPQGALFDNAPQQTTYAMHGGQRAHITLAVRIAKDNKGQWFALPVGMQYGAPVPLTLALRRVQIGRTVFVQPGDAGAVLAAVRGTDGETTT